MSNFAAMNDEAKHKKGSLWGLLLKYGLPLAISVGLCFFLFNNMNFGEMIDFVRHDCNFTWIFMGMAVGVMGFVFRALRWQIQLRASNVFCPTMPMVYSIIGTYAVNLVLPRLGEVWRSEYIARRQKAPFPTVFGSMVAERATDTLTVLLLTLATFLVGGPQIKTFIQDKVNPDGPIYKILTSPYTYMVIVAVIAATVLLLRRYRHNRFVARLIGFWHQLLGGFMSIFHMKGGMRWLLLTVLLWGSYFLQMWMCFRAFNLTDSIMHTHGIIVCLVCFVLGSISMGVPSNGGIGPYQIAVAFGLTCFAPEVDQQQALAFANVVLGAQTLLIIVFGLISFGAIAIDNHRQKN